MAGVNKVIIVGRLGNEPEVKNLGSGQTVTKFSVATSESYPGKDGNTVEKTEWHRIVVWGKLAEICGKYLHKGKQVYVEGKLQSRSWEDPQGVKKYATDIVANTVQFLEKKEGGVSASSGSGSSSSSDFGPEPQFDTSEEIPF